ncbi:MAG: GHKL domain-containing protein [Burkholderiaceae bacterium]|nr:GHKL domain-containing protein [Burkholderiaceae bacterium]
MNINNFLLAYNGLALLWILLSFFIFFNLLKFKDEKLSVWLLLLCIQFTLAPICLFIANHSFPLKSNSDILHLIVALIISCLTCLYFHTLELLNIQINLKKVLVFYLAPIALLIPNDWLTDDLEKYNLIIRTITFHSLAILLLILSVKNLSRIEKTHPHVEIKLTRFSLTAMVFMFSCRILYGIFNNDYLTINPHENVDFFFFLIRLLLVLCGSLTLIFLIFSQKYHLIRINPIKKYSSTLNYDIATALKEREALIESLLKTNKTLSIGALSSSLAHELNQPLSSLNINTSILKKKIHSSNQVTHAITEIFDDIEKSLSKATNIIRTVSNLSEQSESSGQDSFSSVKEVLKDIESLIEPNLRSKKIALHYSSADFFVGIGKSELEQVLLNLFSNAINALSKMEDSIHKRIDIEISETKDMACKILFSSNSGLIDEDTQHNLFELISPSKSKGFGIGLWLSNYILMKNGGSIRYLTKPPHTSEFEITLPLRKK